MKAFLFATIVGFSLILCTIVVMKGIHCSLRDVATVVAMEVAILAIPLGPLTSALLTE